MEPQFYKGNRDAFMEKLEPGSLACSSAEARSVRRLMRTMATSRTGTLFI